MTHKIFSMKTIYLTTDDDIVSICDRLDWNGARQAVLVPPEESDVLRRGLDLIRLRRYADRQRIEIGLVMADAAWRRQAQALGIPAFKTVREAQRNRRGWWRGRRRQEQVGLPTVGGRQVAELKRPFSPHRSDPPPPSPTAERRKWLLRYAGILFFCIAVALLFVSFLYTVPNATIILRPETVQLRTSQPITADPTLSDIDYAAGRLPARTLTVEVSWQAEIETSGTVDVASAPARGTVLITNQTDQELLIPAGTQIGAAEGDVVVETVAAVTLPGVIGSTAEIEVVAVAPGPQGNVAAGVLTQVAAPLAEQVTVRNLEPTRGGGVRQEAAVTETDRERLRSQVIQFLQALAASELSAALTEDEFLPRRSVRVVRFLGETYSHAVGAQSDTLSLEMRAELAGTAVDTNAASGIAYEGLSAQVPAGYTLAPQSLHFETGDVVGADDAGRVTFEMMAEAEAAADLALETSLQQISGQETAVAAAYLNDQLPLRAPPTIDVWPVWFERVPYTPARIRTEIAP